MNNLFNTNNFLNIELKFNNDSSILKNHFSSLMLNVFSKFFQDFFDIRAEVTYPFEVGGYSGCLILGESHINWHTFPEIGSLKIQIYSCKNIENKVEEILTKLATLLGSNSFSYNFYNLP